MTLKFEVDEPFLYGNLTLGENNYLFSNSIIEPGDSIIFRFQNNKWMISGKGSEKYIVVQEINQALKNLNKHRTDSILKLSEKYDDNYITFKEDSIGSYVKAFSDDLQFNRQQSIIIRSKLDSNRNRLSNKIFQLLKLDFLYTLYYEQAKSLTFYDLLARNRGSEFADSCYSQLKNLYDYNLKDYTKGIDQDIINVSNGYFRYLIEDLKLKKNSVHDCILYINKNFVGLLKDRLITYYFVRGSIQSEQDVKLISTARNDIKTKYCLDILDAMLQNSSPGKNAYNFALSDTLGNIVKLSDFKGKVVLLDFFFTGCGFCKVLNEKMLPIYEQYKDNKNFQFISISIDKDLMQWKNSLRSLQYTHVGSVDLYTKGEGSKSEIIKHYNIRAYPKIILIDKFGKVLSANPPEPHDEKSRLELIKIINKAL